MDSKTRFSNRVDNYVQYRPSYPEQAVDYLLEKVKSKDSIADVGAGTGIFTRKLLERGYRVIAVEPNAEMRQAAETMLQEFPLFLSVDGTAEATTLADHSVAGIVSAQAFHWFDLVAAKEEFKRIIKPDGFVALVWNKRVDDADAFAIEYELLLKQSAVDYTIVDHRLLGHEQFSAFFREGHYERQTFNNEQQFNLAGLIGRALSSSYTPPQGSVHHDAFVAKLEALYNKHQQAGYITFHYETEVYLGQV